MRMIDFFKWWYTDSNGQEYMSLLNCAMNDYLLVYSIVILCFGVVFQYIDISYKHFVNYSKYPETELSKYFIGITKVFFLCMITGYGYRILSVWINPYKLLMILLLILNFYTYKFRKANKGIDVFYKIYDLEKRFGIIKQKINDISESLTINLFTSKGEIKLIPYSALDSINYDTPFDSDGSGAIVNTRIDIELPCFMSKSVMKPNQYIPPHQHDTDKILKCVKGSFFDNKTNKWYKKGEYLLIPKYSEQDRTKNWHDIKTGNEETHLITFINPID